jgi:hypothetical protein
VSIITYDLPRAFGQIPKPGELIASISRVDSRTLSVYLILSAREVRRRRPSDYLRFKLKVRMVERGDPKAKTQWWMHWNSRSLKTFT